MRKNHHIVDILHPILTVSKLETLLCSSTGLSSLHNPPYDPENLKKLIAIKRFSSLAWPGIKPPGLRGILFLK
jgi:hypothetical protein